MTTQSSADVQRALEARFGGRAKVSINGEVLHFEVDAGPRMQAVGGFCGGTTSGTIAMGKFFPSMTSGPNPFTLREWVNLLGGKDWYAFP
jgi:hypothetical protein